MAESRPRALRHRLASAFLTVAMVSLGVLFVGTVLPHLPDQHLDPHDPVSLVWLLVATGVAALTAVVLSIVISRRLTRPVEAYIETAQRFAAGDHSARPTDPGPPEFAELTAAMIGAADEVERSEQARRQLTADIAHELRTPLTALQAGLEELRDGLVPAEPETLAALHAQATRLSRIVSDLSELSAAESTGLQVELVPVDLGQLAALALAARGGSLAVAGLEVSSELPSGVVVLADEDRMHQSIGNLLANASLYCRPGDQVTVRVHREPGVGVLEVADTGPGFRAEELPHIFDRTWRGHSAGGTRGSGLGLPIVRALVRAQGGEVTVESVEGAGATVRITLPPAPEGAAPAR